MTGLKIELDWASEAADAGEPELRRELVKIINRIGDGLQAKIITMSGPAAGWPIIELSAPTGLPIRKAIMEYYVGGEDALADEIMDSVELTV